MNPSARQLLLNDGRRLGYSEYGVPDGRALLYFHGFPSSRLEGAYCNTAARRLGIRVIAVDRPGYGLSDFQPGRRITDWPDDVRELADHLGLERFAVLGVSGGGPYALACAWKLAGRLTVAKVVGGLAPLHVATALQVMRWNARLSFALAKHPDSPWWWMYGTAVGQLLRLFPGLAYRAQQLGGAAKDRAVLDRQDIRDILRASLQEGLRRGPRGACWDAVLFVSDWGFPLDRIRMPVELWYGEADHIVPPLHARLLAAALPDARLELVEGEGHYSLPIVRCEQVLG